MAWKSSTVWRAKPTYLGCHVFSLLQGIFKNNWNWFVSSLCLGLLREKGTTVQKFFPDVLKSVYSLRLKGEQHLEGYNFQRTMDELIEGLNEKVEEKEVEKEEEEKEVEPSEKTDLEMKLRSR